MIREEKNAMLLLLAFVAAAAGLYVLVVRPALQQATTSRASAESVGDRDANADDDTGDPDAASDASDLRTRAARRMVAVRLRAHDASNGSPLPGATVRILGVDDVAAEPLVVAEDAGRFRVDFLPPEISFQLRVECAGFRSFTSEHVRGEAHRILDLGVIPLEPVRSLALRVEDASGAPLEGAALRVFACGDEDSRDPIASAVGVAAALQDAPIGATETDANGRAVLDELPAARAIVLIDAHDHGARVLADVDLRAASVTRRARFETVADRHGTLRTPKGAIPAGAVLLLEPGAPGRTSTAFARAELDAGGAFTARFPPDAPAFALPVAPGTVLALSGPHPAPLAGASFLCVAEPGRAWSGRILDAERRAVRNARVEVSGLRPGDVPRTLVSGPDGRCESAELPPGPLRIRAHAAGVGADERVVDASAAETSITLAGFATLRGTARDARDGRALPGTIVRADWPGVSAHCGADGAYALAGVAPGRVVARAERAGYRSARLECTATLGSASEVNASLAPGHGLRVLVALPDRTRAAGALVLIAPVTDGKTPDGTDLRRAIADADGAAEFEGLAPDGSFVLFAAHPPYAPAYSQVFQLDAERERSTVTLTLLDAAFLEGEVRVERASAPDPAAPDAPMPQEIAPSAPARARVEALSADPDATVRMLATLLVGATASGDGGAFRLGPLPPGTWRIRATTPACTPAFAGPFKLALGQRRAGVALLLAPAAPLRGVVVCGGAPLPGARVRLVGGEAGGDSRDVLTDGGGRFALLAPAEPGQVLEVLGPQKGRARFEETGAAGPDGLRLELSEP